MLALALLTPFLAVARATLSASDVATIQQNLANADLGGLVGNFTPAGLIDATFNGTAITIGQNLTQAQAGNFPTLTVNPVENQTVLSDNDTYTALMVDAGIVGTDLSGSTETLHWLINGIHLNGTSNAAGPFPLNYSDGSTIVEYAGPAPAEGSGAHRYAIILFAQPADFAAPAGFNAGNTSVANNFSLTSYISDSKLGNAVAANYFTVENGVATVTVSTTQAANATIAPGAGTNATATTTGEGGAATSDVSGGAGNGTGAGGAEASSTGKSGASTLLPGTAIAALVAGAVAALL